ncbi:hypothetical protein ACQPZF_28770 [Actinosynnema sp. CS-041913]|uniref:hypothetical protein n=1 Tax=Actinosynnema sp. CS-041913 TaxID=3239917 RepID=UPI003D8AA052
MSTSRERAYHERSYHERRRAPARRTGPPPRVRKRFLTPGRVVRSLLPALAVTAVVKTVLPTTSPLVTAALAIALGAPPLAVDLVRELPGVRARGAGPNALLRVALVLLAVGGAAAWLATSAVDRVTAHEEVLAGRLAAPAAGEVGPLVATVEDVRVTENFTKVTVSAVNRSALAAKVSVVDSCRLVGADGTELRLDGLFEVLRERFFLDVPGGGAVVRETLAFPGTLPAGETTATLGCGSVSWHGTDPAWSGRDLVGRSLRVPDLRLAAVR